MSISSTLINQLVVEEAMLQPLTDAYIILQAESLGELKQLNAGPTDTQASKKILLKFIDHLIEAIGKPSVPLALRPIIEFLNSNCPTKTACLDRLIALRHTVDVNERATPDTLRFMGEILSVLGGEFAKHLKTMTDR